MFTSDNKFSFLLDEKLTIKNSNYDFNTFAPIHAQWGKDNETLFVVDSVDLNKKEKYIIKSFNAQTGEERILFKDDDNVGPIGFIINKNKLAYSTTTEIGLIDLQNLNVKKLHQFPKVDIDGDMEYVPDLQNRDDSYFTTAIYDKDYSSNSVVTIWKFSWEGDIAERVNSFTDE